MQTAEFCLLVYLTAVMSSAQYVERKVKFQLKSNGPIYEGDKVSLRCQLKGNPAGWKYELYWDGYSNTNPYKTQRESTFTIGPVTRSFSGQYWCQAGKGGHQWKYSENVKLDVSVRRAKLQLKSDGPIYEGDKVSLHCQLDGNPVGWTYGIYKWESIHSYLYKVQTESTFTFSPVTHSQRGWYRCVGGKGDVYSTYSKYVWLEVSERFSKPTLSILPSATVWEGDNVTLGCLSLSEVTGTQLRYKFYRDERPLSEETPQNEFTIQSAQQNQTGRYWCEVKEEGKETEKKTSARVQLTVKAMCVTLSASPSTSVKVGDSINLTCTWEGKVSSTLIFNFLRNNETVKSSSDSAVFSINQADKNHTGSYMCAVESSARNQTYSNEIEIEVQAFTGAGKQEFPLTIVYFSVGLGLVFLILVLLLLPFANHRSRGLPSIRSSKTGRKEKGEDVITPSGGAHQMDPLNKEEENSDMLYSVLMDPPKGKNKDDSAIEFNDDVVYSDLVKGKLMKKRENLPEEATGVLYSDIKLKNASGASAVADSSSLYASVPRRKDKK